MPHSSLVTFGSPRLLVIGDLMLDRYVWGDAERVSPEAPVLVLREDLDEVRPGGASNVASFLRGLAAEVLLAGVLGDDAAGRTLQRLMDDLSVDTSAVITDPSRPTTTKQRIVGRSPQRQPHQILRIDRESRTPLSPEVRQRLIDSILALLPSCAAVLISDYAKGVCAPDLLRIVIDQARGLRLPVLIDPARGVDYQRYARATLLTPNRVATERALKDDKTRDWSATSPDNSPEDTPVGILSHPDTIRRAAAHLRAALQLDAIVLTLDRDGLAYATAAATGLVPCRHREVCDVTGAGDMVLAVLGLCLAEKLPLVDSLHLANAAAGLEVERFGVEPVTRAEIARELARDHAASRPPMTLDQLLIQLQQDRQANRTIVFTNGCFDLLHVGHVSLLEEAAAQGDVLIVAINSDASVRKLKGTARPIIGETDRARMLAALACVDHVLVFDDDTPHRLLEAIRPDVLVKGGTTGHIVGREIVEAYGGRIVQTTTIDGLSTTDLVQRLRSSESPFRVAEEFC